MKTSSSISLVVALMACGAACVTSQQPTDARDEDAMHPDTSMSDGALDVASDSTALDAPNDSVVDAAADVPMDRVVRMVTTNFQDGVSPTAAYSGTRDTYLSESAPTMNLGTSTTLWADGDIPAGMNATRNMLVSWDVSAIPIGSTVMSASITFTMSTATASMSTNRYSIYALLRMWSETEASWNDTMTAAPWATPGASELGRDRGVQEIGGVGPLSSGATTVHLNAGGVALVQQWINDPSMNFGIEVSNLTAADGLGVASREATPASARPKLSVVYLTN